MVSYVLLQWLLLLIVRTTHSFVSLTNNRKCMTKADTLFRLSSSSDSNTPPNKKPKDVENAISDVMDMLAKKSGIDLNAKDTGENIEILTSQFQKILQDMRSASSSSSLTDTERSAIFYTEAQLTLNNYNRQDKMKLPKYDTSLPSTKFYSEALAPYICVYSTGPIGLKIKSSFKELGNSVQVKYLDSNVLLGLSDSELKFICKGAKTMILACDNDNSKAKRGWLDPVPPFSSLTANGLKRLFNTVMTENLKLGIEGSSVKVVALCQGIKEGKSVGSLLSGDTFDLENEVILLANQRSFSYVVVKVGNVVNDDVPSTPITNKDATTTAATTTANVIIPESSIVKKMKETYFSLPSSSSSSSSSKPSVKVLENVKNQVLSRPMMITLSRLDQTECTCASVASETMLRAAAFPMLNSTSFAVISTPTASNTTSTSTSVSTTDSTSPTRSQPSTEDYNDELSKLIGPELYRIPLKYASAQQVLVKLNRVINKLLEPASGLITPIAVEKYANAVRIIFKPKESPYMSLKDEKLIITESVNDSSSSSSINKPKATAGYMSPEMEAKLEKEAAAAAASTTSKVSMNPSTTTTSSSSSSSAELLNKQKKASLKLEGGIEVLVDELPYKRIRIRRCNMGRNTIVKEESEALILKAILNNIQVLENDYRIMLDTDLSSLTDLKV